MIRRFQGRLSDPGYRRRAGRWLLIVAAAGIAASLWRFGRDHWFFIAVVWIGLVYVPARLALEVLATGAGRAREQQREAVAGSRDRYRSRAAIELLVEHLYDRDVTMPRIVGRRIDKKVRRPAVEIVARPEGDRAAAVREGAVRAIAVAEWGAGRLAETLAQPIQERWERIRAIAGMAALGRLLVEVYEDLTGGPFAVNGATGDEVRAFVEACFDYCDQVGLDLSGPVWEPLALAPAPADESAEETLAAYSRYVETPDPAPTPLARFLDLVRPGQA